MFHCKHCQQLVKITSAALAAGDPITFAMFAEKISPEELSDEYQEHNHEELHDHIRKNLFQGTFNHSVAKANCLNQKANRKKPLETK